MSITRGSIFLELEPRVDATRRPVNPVCSSPPGIGTAHLPHASNRISGPDNRIPGPVHPVRSLRGRIGTACMYIRSVPGGKSVVRLRLGRRSVN